MLGLLVWSAYRSKADFEIAHRQQITVAAIKSQDHPNHDRYGCIFFLNKTKYAGWAYPSDRIKYSIGKQILVHYDPVDPSRNSPESFEEVVNAICSLSRSAY
jgi:hypothetical protein